MEMLLSVYNYSYYINCDIFFLFFCPSPYIHLSNYTIYVYVQNCTELRLLLRSLFCLRYVQVSSLPDIRITLVFFKKPKSLKSHLKVISVVKYPLSDKLHFFVREFAGRDGSQSQFEIFLAEIFVSIKVLIT